MNELESYRKIVDVLDDGYKELAELIKSKGGLIKIDYSKYELPDYIYAELYNSSGDLTEWYVHGICVDEGGDIAVAASCWVEEDDDFLDLDENWDSLKFGGNVLYASTLINILEVIHEYL